MARTVQQNVTGLAGISAVLDGLPREMRLQILGEAVGVAADPIVESAKRNARRSVRTGALYASIGEKVKEYPNQAVAVAVVGPQRGQFARGGVKIDGSKSWSKAFKTEQPANYAHLVEFGHATRKPVRGRKLGKGVAEKAAAGKLQWVAPRPFMRPAFVESRAAVTRKLVEGIGIGVEKARAKLVKEGAHAA